jgi:hypothetical protein
MGFGAKLKKILRIVMMSLGASSPEKKPAQKPQK